MSLFDSPTSFRTRELMKNGMAVLDPRHVLTPDSQLPALYTASNAALGLLQEAPLPPHSQHPNFFNLAGLVSEAVLEVVFVALPGFLVAYTGMFDANSQKFVAELNTMVFTPCLIFTKLASQLNADKLADLIVIPFIFAAQTLVSWICAQCMARLFGFSRKPRQKNFILAMGVFGNSNSLPISLVLSLSKTIQGLHWDKIPGDNDNEVAARGILYLLIFQQLGQLLRWTWGYSVLLKPASAYDEEEQEAEAEEERITEEGRYRDDADDIVREPLNGHAHLKPRDFDDSGFTSASSAASVSSLEDADPDMIPSTPANGNAIANEPRHLKRTSNGTFPHPTSSDSHITAFPSFSATSIHESDADSDPDSDSDQSWKATFRRAKRSVLRSWARVSDKLSTLFLGLFRRLPGPLQRILRTIHSYHMGFWRGVWRQMNPPLWAMLAALVVASVPQLQHLFFDPGTLINNSVTRAVSQTGGVAVPLILVVLGANLARSTLPQDQLATTPEAKKEERKLLYASLISRMVLPTIIMAPILALCAKYVPISILDDPIFIIVCFLLTGAPSALQLAQICQINGVFMGAMSNLLVASYVVAIFPSTLTLVLLALEVLEWAVTG